MNLVPDKRLKILFLTPRLPYPLIGGDRLKPFNILSYLCKYHDVTLVSFYQGAESPKESIRKIEALGVKLHVINVDAIKSGLRAGVLSLFSSMPLEISFYYQPEFALLVERLMKKENFDLTISFFMRTAEYAKNLKCKKFLMAEDCRTEYQKRSHEEAKSIKQRIIRGFEFKKLQKYEPEIVNHFDVTTLVTNIDIDLMKSRNPKPKYRLLTNGVEIDKFVPPKDFSARKEIYFVGKLDIYANVLMLKKITAEIFPEIKKLIPGVKLVIVGANPPAEIKKLVAKDIILHANVPDTIPYLQSARVFLHPHSGGSGIQNKLLEAMSCGCPVVTTPTGNQGIDATDGVNIMICKNNEELIAKTILLLKDNELASTISINSRKHIEEHFSWQAIFLQMKNILNELFKDE